MNKAIEFYTLSANKGNSYAQFNLAICYENGDGVEKDMTKAIEFYTLSANQGNSRAQFNLAICYKNGNGVERYD